MNNKLNNENAKSPKQPIHTQGEKQSNRTKNVPNHASSDPTASDHTSSNPKKKILSPFKGPVILSSFTRLFAFFILILIGIIAISYGTIQYMVDQESEITVPDIKGMDVIEASDALFNMGLHIRLVAVNRDFSSLSEETLGDDRELTPRYTVLSQDPAAGMNVKTNRIIIARVNMSNPKTTVPDFVGQSLEKVLRFLDKEPMENALYCAVGDINYIISDQEAGTVLDQIPAPHTMLNEITPIELVVSKGIDWEVQKHPDVTNWHIHKAAGYYAMLNLPYQIKYQFVDDPEYDGKVLEQSIPADTLCYPMKTQVFIIGTLQKQPPYFYYCCDVLLPSSPDILEIYTEDATTEYPNLELSIEIQNKEQSFLLFQGMVSPGMRIVQCYESFGVTKEIIRLNDKVLEVRELGSGE